MSAFTLDDLRRILRTCAGDAEANGLTESSLDVRFGDLGYDSLALFATVAQVDHEFGIQIPDDLITQLETPREFLAAVERSVAGKS
jgi:act minimal PKS acyl carrier protein